MSAEAGPTLDARRQPPPQQSGAMARQATVSSAAPGSYGQEPTPNLGGTSQQPTQTQAQLAPAPPISAKFGSYQNPNQATAGVSPIETGAATAYGGLQSGLSGVFLLGVQAGAGTKEVLTGEKIGGDLGTFKAGGVTAGQAARFVGETGAYVFPGAAVLKGEGESNAPGAQRAFDVGVGLLPFVPFGAVGEAVASTGRAGVFATQFGGSVGGKVAIGAGIGAAGAAAYGGGPTQIAEGALIGGVVFGAVGVAGKGIEAVSEHFNTPPERAPPVAGGGLEYAMGVGPKGEPLGISPGAKTTGMGFQTTAPEETQPPVSMSEFVQDIEGSKPTGGPLLERETAPPSPPASTSFMTEHITDMPYSSMFDISEDIRLGKGVTAMDFTKQETQTAPFSRTGGAAGGTRDFGGYAGGEYGGQTSEQTLRYPGESFDTSSRLRSMEMGFSTTEAAGPGQTTANLFAILPPGAMTKPTFGGASTGLKTVPGTMQSPIQSPNQFSNVSQTLDTSIKTETGPGFKVTQIQPQTQGREPFQGSFSTVDTLPKQPQGSQTQPIFGPPLTSPLQSNIPKGPSGGTIFSYLNPPSDKKAGRKQKELFGFRTLHHKVPDLFSLGGKMKGGKRKRF